MPDVRLPSRWLTDPDRVNLSDAASRINWSAYMWSAEHWTDGRIPTAAVRMFPVDEGIVRAVAIEELVTAKLWRVTKAGWQILKWDETQTTAEEHETRRQQWRDSKRRKRAGDRERPLELDATSPLDLSADAEVSTVESTWTPKEEEEAEEEVKDQAQAFDARTDDVQDLTVNRWTTVDGRRMRVPA